MQQFIPSVIALKTSGSEREKNTFMHSMVKECRITNFDKKTVYIPLQDNANVRVRTADFGTFLGRARVRPDN